MSGNMYRHPAGRQPAHPQPAQRELVCPNRYCAAELWLVRHDPVQRNLWYVAISEHARPMIVASSEPLCPICATTLTVGYTVDEDTGPIFTFLRSLA